MGYLLSMLGMEEVIQALSKEYVLYAPKIFKGGGRFSDTDCIRYGEIKGIEEIEFHKKSDYSFKEVLTPISQTLFYFTEDTVKEANPERKKAIVFLRSCDLHEVKRLDDMYLHNGPEDYYYQRLREYVKFVLLGCQESFDSCFCVDMGRNQSENYDFSLEKKDGQYYVECKCSEMNPLFLAAMDSELQVTPSYVTDTKIRVDIPENLNSSISKSNMWRDYDSRCINCGRCNFVCPTCTCFTMQDLYYSENGKVGERRRIWASCMVDGFTDVAGGGSYRQKMGMECTSRYSIKYWISKSEMDTICVWVVEGVMIFVRNIYHFPIA